MYDKLCLFMFEEDYEIMKSNEPGKQKLETQNVWQSMKHANW